MKSVFVRLAVAVALFLFILAMHSAFTGSAQRADADMAKATLVASRYREVKIINEILLFSDLSGHTHECGQGYTMLFKADAIDPDGYQVHGVGVCAGGDKEPVIILPHGEVKFTK